MAFNQSNAQRSNPAGNNTTNADWKAQGFINLYLPTKAGGRRKLAGIPLKDSKPSEQEMRLWLEASDVNVATLLSKLIVEYQPATQTEGSGFDLG
jgi:hypothetical protein